MLSLLYVDDEPGLLEIGKLFLETSGEFSVTTVMSGKEALGQLAQQRFDAVVSDYQMPEMDGLELLKSVRRSFGNLPFILFTGRGREEIVIEAINNGVDFYLQKGGDPKAQFAELAHKIRQAVGRRRAETALSDSEQRLADIINFLPDATFAIDNDGNVIAWNRAMEEVTGVGAKGIMGKGNYEYAVAFYGERRPMLIDLVMRPDAQFEQARYLFTHRSSSTLTAETELEKKDGTRIHLWGKASHLFDQEGRQIGAIESIRDITEMKKSEKALSDSEQRLADIINFLPDATFAINTDGQVIAWNRAIEEMTGIAAADILGKAGYEYALPFYGTRRPILIDLIFESEGKIAQYYSNILRDGNTLSAETNLPHPKGRQIHVLAKASPLYNREGSVTGAIEAIRDITDRKKAEEELLAANEQLAASGEELRAQYDELAEGEKRIRESEARLNFMIGFYEYSRRSERELLKYAIEGAGVVTGSPLGYLAFLSEDESELSMYAWSKAAMAECSMREKPIVYKTEKTGLWGEPVRQRRPVITNDYEAPDPKKRGYPEGHPRILRHMGVPVMDEGRIVLVAGVANKPSDYTDNDSHELALLMRGLWSIIKRKRAEQNVRNTLAFLNALIDQNPNPVWISDNKGFLIRMNAACGRLLHSNEEELVGKYNIFEDTVVEKQGYIPLVRSVFDEGKVASFELTYDTALLETISLKENVSLVLEVTVFPVRDAAGTITNAVIMHNDITSRKRAESEMQAAYEQVAAAEEELRSQYDELARAQLELRNRQEQLEEIAGTVPGVVFQFYARPDRTMGMYYASRRAVELLGINKNLEEFFPALVAGIHPEDRERFLGSVHEVVSSGTAWDFTGRYTKPSGETIWFRGLSSPVQHGNELVFSGVILDITDLKGAEQALLQERTFTDALLDSIPGLFYLYNDEGRLIRWNRNHETVTGYSAEELMGRHVLDWYSDEEDAARIREAIDRALRDGHSSAEANITIKGGKKIPFYFTAVTLEVGGKRYFTGIGTEIARLRETETALRESEERYRVLTDFAFDGILIQDFNGHILFTNPSIRRMMGITDPTMLRGKTSLDFVKPEYQELLMEDLENVRSGKGGYLQTYRVQTWEGKEIWVETVGTTIQYNGKDANIVALRDITDRKAMEEKLRESEEKYRLIAENSPDMIYFIDPKGYVRYVNTFAAQALKTEPGAVTGKHVTELFGSEVAQHRLDEINRVITTMSPVRTEIFENLPSGGVWIDLRLSPLVDESGRVLGVLGHSHDISDRKKAEAALRESETKYRLLVENSYDIIYTINSDGVLTFVSPSWTALLGYDPTNVTGKPFQQFVHPADVPECEVFLAKVVSSRQRQSGVEYRVIHADGSIRIHTSTISPILDSDGSIISYIGNARDITEMKQTQNAIRESNRKLNLLSSITRHDVANQLTVVQGYTQLAALRKTDPVTTDFLAKIASAVDMIQHQIEFTRTYQDLGVQAPAWHRVADVIQGVRPSGIKLLCTCDATEIFADPMIGKVFFNLFDNAVKYGQRVTTITVGCEPKGDELVITFADDGIGIPLNEKQKIFEKGFGQHTGFGLFLAREILAITGISIHETGSYGKGARFEIAVPKGAYRSP
jgi:PAS domain S-box-containing protein